MNDTTYPPIQIGEVNGLPVFLEEGKGRNESAITYDGRTVRQGFAFFLGAEVENLYAAWYAANRE